MSKNLISVGVITLLFATGGYFIWLTTVPYTPKCEKFYGETQEPIIYFNEYQGEMVFKCPRAINQKDNRCVEEVFRVKTGEKISTSQEGACYTTPIQ